MPAVLGVFPLVPLVFAWVSTNGRRWSRVEGVLGRDLPTGHDRVQYRAFRPAGTSAG